MEKGKKLLLILLFVILAAMGTMAGTFLAGGGLKPRPEAERGKNGTVQANAEPAEGRTAGAEAGQETKNGQEREDGRETKASIRLETAAEETETEPETGMPVEGYFANYEKMTEAQIQAGLQSMGLLDPLPVTLW